MNRILRCRPVANVRTPHFFGTLILLFLGILLAGCEQPVSLDEIRALQSQQKYEKTLAPLRSYLETHSEDVEASYLYGRALVGTGQASLAVWPLRHAMKDPEWLVQAGTQLAHAMLSSNDFNETVNITTTLLAEDPENQVALLLRAQAHAHWRQDPASALADAEALLALNPDAIEAYEPMILALVLLERTEEATSALAEAGRRLEEMDAAPSTMAWHCSTSALFLIGAGDSEGADEKWQECLAEYPGDATVVTNVVEFLDSKAEWDRSVEVLERAYQAAPDQPGFRIAYAGRLATMGRSEEGEAILVAATEAVDVVSASRAWVDLSQFHQMQKDHVRAAEDLGKAIETIRPHEQPSQQLLFQRADALVAASALDQALEASAELAVPAQRRLIEARVAQEGGDFDLALKAFDEALALWPDNASGRYYAARAAENVGDFDRALEEYRYAIRIAPGGTDARTRVARLLLAQGAPVLAYQLLFFEVAKYPLEPEGETLSMYLMARLANPAQLQAALRSLAARDPSRLPEAFASGAKGAAEVSGPQAALRVLGGMPGAQLVHSDAAPALIAIVRYAHEAEVPEVAATVLESALREQPELGLFHALVGLHRELGGKSSENVQAAYDRAIALEPTQALALGGLARIRLAAADYGQAARLFLAAAESDSSEPDYRREAARALLEAGRTDEAATQLDTLLAAFPFDAGAAAARADLDLAEKRVSETTQERAQRAVNLIPSAENFLRLSRVHTALNEPERAEAAAASARAVAPAE